MKLKNKNVLVYGLGKSGIAACNLLIQKKANVYLYDDDKSAIESIKNSHIILGSYDIIFQFNEDMLNYIDLIVLNPAVSVYHEHIKLAQLKGVPVISELELGYQNKNGQVIGVSGTNGKTTTIELIAHILVAGGILCTKSGNIGTPLSESIKENKKNTVYVTEVSSFQLETSKKFKPHIAGLLNITPDHLNRHFTIENYIKEKAKLFKNMKKNNIAVLNFDDEIVKNLKNTIKANTYFFSIKQALEKGVFVKDKNIIFKENGKEEVLLKVSDVKLIGQHNLSNVCCASLICYLYGVKKTDIENAVKTFLPSDHRLQFVGLKNEVEYYDDSKATNIDATLKAVASFTKNIVLMLGGSEKDENFDDLFSALPKNVKHITVSGQNKEKIINSAKKYKFSKIHITSSFVESFNKAVELVKKNEIVLLAPASASFDEFHNYAHRGDKFQELVLSL